MSWDDGTVNSPCSPRGDIEPIDKAGSPSISVAAPYHGSVSLNGMATCDIEYTPVGQLPCKSSVEKFFSPANRLRAFTDLVSPDLLVINVKPNDVACPSCSRSSVVRSPSTTNQPVTER